MVLIRARVVAVLGFECSNFPFELEPIQFPYIRLGFLVVLVVHDSVPLLPINSRRPDYSKSIRLTNLERYRVSFIAGIRSRRISLVCLNLKALAHL